MKKLFVVALSGMISMQSQAQTLGKQIDGAKESMGPGIMDKAIDQSALLAEYYGKRSILASILSAKEFNRAVGLETVAEESHVAIPLVAIGALYATVQTYQIADAGLRGLKNMAPASKVDSFVQEALKMDTELANLKSVATSLESEILQLEVGQTRLATQSTEISGRITSLKGEIESLEKSIKSLERARGNSAVQLQARQRIESQITANTETIASKRVAIAGLENDLNKLAPSKRATVLQISEKRNLLASQKSAIAKLDGHMKSHLSLISKKKLVRSAMSRLQSAARGTLLIGSVLVGAAIVSDVVILTASEADLNKLLNELESDIKNLEAVL